jgi:hypothetical protein
MEAEEEELEGPLVALSLRNVKGLAIVLQAIKPGSKQVQGDLASVGLSCRVFAEN